TGNAKPLIIFGPCIPTTQRAFIKNTITKTPSQVSVKLTTKPKGYSIALNISSPTPIRVPLIINTANARTKVGIRAENDLLTPAGTCSGSLIIKLYLTHNLYN